MMKPDLVLFDHRSTGFDVSPGGTREPFLLDYLPGGRRKIDVLDATGYPVEIVTPDSKDVLFEVTHRAGARVFYTLDGEIARVTFGLLSFLDGVPGELTAGLAVETQRAREFLRENNGEVIIELNLVQGLGGDRSAWVVYANESEAFRWDAKKDRGFRVIDGGNVAKFVGIKDLNKNVVGYFAFSIGLIDDYLILTVGDVKEGVAFNMRRRVDLSGLPDLTLPANAYELLNRLQ